MARSRSIVREVSTAIAVLAIYCLVLLLPLHQSAASQRAFAKLGFDSIGGWSICVAGNTDSGTNDLPTAAKCPVTGVAKQDFVGIEPTVAPIVIERIDAVVAYDHGMVLGIPALAAHFAQSRAPPSLMI